MSMTSFRDALKTAASYSTEKTAPAAAPSFLTDMVEAAVAVSPSEPEVVAEAIVHATSALPPRTESIKPATTTGFSAMLQRIASKEGAQAVSILDEAASAPIVPPHVETPGSAEEVNENILVQALGPTLSRITEIGKITPQHVDEGILGKHHSEAHKHLAAAEESLVKAHGMVSRAHELATDDHHKAGLKHQMDHITTLWNGIRSAKEAGNLANHAYMKTTGRLA